MRHHLAALLTVVAVLVVPLSAAVGDLGSLAEVFDLDGPSFSRLLLKESPKTDFQLRMGLSYSKPGVFLDTVGLNAAAVGAWEIHVAGDGHVVFQVFDPQLKSPWRNASGWHVLTSKEVVPPGQSGTVGVFAQGLQLRLQVASGKPLVLPLRVPLSGAPLWVGDFPGDDTWGAGHNIHPAMTGRLVVSLLWEGATPPVSATPAAPARTKPARTKPARTKPAVGSVPAKPQAGATGSAQTGVGAGPVLAETRIGPAGGTLVAANKIRVTLPPGALAKEEVLRIRQMTVAGQNATVYGIERQGTGLLLKPAAVALPLPAGTDPTQVCVFHELDGDLATIMPARYDPATRSMVTSTLSFSYLGWDTYAKYAHEYVSKAGYGGIVGAVVVVGVVTVLGVGSGVGIAAAAAGLKALTLVHAGVVIVVGMIGGVTGGDAMTKYGLNQSLTISADPQNAAAEFRLSWDGTDKSMQRIQISAVCNAQGQLLGWLPGGVTDQQLRLVQQEMQQALGPQMVGDQPLTKRQVPRGVLRVGAELCLARQLLRNTGLTVPDRTEVLVRDTGGSDAGAFVPPFLNVARSTLEARTTKQITERQATLLHEYYHATCYRAKTVNNTYQWLEEAIAVSLEAEFAGYEGYRPPDANQTIYGWPQVGPALASGFVNARPELGEAEDYSKRGYRLWPWPRWLTHTQGWPTLWRAAGDGLDAQAIRPLFDGFALALLTSDQAVGDPDMVRRPWDVQQRVNTGWSLRQLADFRVADGLALGRLALPAHLAAPRPLSLNVLGLQMTQDGATGGPLVVRRTTPCADEGYWLLPQSAWTAFTPAASLRRANGCLVVPAAELSAGCWPLALVDCATTNGTVNPLLCYRLNAPGNLVYAPAEGDQKAKLTWDLPELGANLKPSDCLDGYRMFGKTKAGRETLIAELWFDLPKASLVQVPGKLALSIASTETQVELPAKVTAGYTAVGLQSIEKVRRDGKLLLLSDIAWSDVAGGKWVLFDKDIRDGMPKSGKSERTNGTQFREIAVVECKVSADSVIYSRKITQHNPVFMKSDLSATHARQARWTPAPDSLAEGDEFTVEVSLGTVGSGTVCDEPVSGSFVNYGLRGGDIVFKCGFMPAAGSMNYLISPDRSAAAHLMLNGGDPPKRMTMAVRGPAKEGDVLLFSVELRDGFPHLEPGQPGHKFSYQATYKYRFQPAGAK